METTTNNKGETMKQTAKIIKALQYKNPSDVIANGNTGCGFMDCKLKAGTTANTALVSLYYLFNDLSIDMHLDIDKDALAKEIYGV